MHILCLYSPMGHGTNLGIDTVWFNKFQSGNSKDFNCTGRPWSIPQKQEVCHCLWRPRSLASRPTSLSHERSLVYSMNSSDSKNGKQEEEAEDNGDQESRAPIILELTGKYWATGFLITRISFSPESLAVTLKFWSNWTELIFGNMWER